jgi:hypothetical protein
MRFLAAASADEIIGPCHFALPRSLRGDCRVGPQSALPQDVRLPIGLAPLPPPFTAIPTIRRHDVHTETVIHTNYAKPFVSYNINSL